MYRRSSRRGESGPPLCCEVREVDQVRLSVTLVAVVRLATLSLCLTPTPCQRVATASLARPQLRMCANITLVVKWNSEKRKTTATRHLR